MIRKIPDLHPRTEAISTSGNGSGLGITLRIGRNVDFNAFC